ncbi:MAG TPA: class I SAM-dependent methyltransferase [Kofleriaceae bacterium]|nr:class I SAM-dependent methyltransferase [Kofleriaceae bacterium]
MRLYDDLAGWYHLLSPPENHGWEADHYAALWRGLVDAPRTLLDLGAGGGCVASHLRRDFACTLVDRSPAMLDTSRAVNPDCEHVAGDLRDLRLGRTFDGVLLGDALMYLRGEGELEAAIATAFAHTRPGGAALFVPDCTRETFRPGDSHGGTDTADGARGLRWLQWVRDPDPADDSFTTDWALMLREGDRIEVVHEQHRMALLARATYGRLIAAAGFRLIDEPAHAGVLIGTRDRAST